MKKLLLFCLICLTATGCVMFKYDSNGLWGGISWTDAGNAVSKVLPQTIDDKLHDAVESKLEDDQ